MDGASENRVAKIEQATEELSRTLPQSVGTMFRAYIAQQFTRDEALALTRDFQNWMLRAGRDEKG